VARGVEISKGSCGDQGDRKNSSAAESSKRMAPRRCLAFSNARGNIETEMNERIAAIGLDGEQFYVRLFETELEEVA
jgi:hypothetical protein